MQQKVEGIIKFYSLEEWWLSSFSDNEQKYIDEKYQPMGLPPHSLTKGNCELSASKTDFLSSLETWFKSREDSLIAEKIRKKLKEVAEREPNNKPGYFQGRHYSSYVSEVDLLIREGKLEEAESLLYHLVDATEAENKAEEWGVAPRYYEKLAIIYKKQKDLPKEIAILERFANQKHAPGVKPQKLLERLEVAKQKLSS